MAHVSGSHSAITPIEGGKRERSQPCIFALGIVSQYVAAFGTRHDSSSLISDNT